MKKEGLIKIGISSITVIVLFILVFSSPAQAFLIGLTTTDTTVSKGNIIDFIAFLKINSDEFVNVDYINLKINNSNSTSDCKFLLNGTIVSGCSGITIIPFTQSTFSAQYGYGYGYIYGFNSNYGYEAGYGYEDNSNYGYEAGYGYDANYGYGYGWNDGVIKYNITLDTTDYDVGTYQTFLEVKTSDKITVQDGTGITITPFVPSTSSQECSLRADLGVITVENKMFNTNKLNFYVSTKNAQRGGGTISSQTGRDRFTYSFKITQDISEDKDNLVILVSGKYRIGRANDSIETAIFTLDKKTKKVSIVGPNIDAQNLSVNFMLGCGSSKAISNH